MLEIFGRKNSSNVIPVMWAIGEIGLEHKRHNIGGSFGGDDTAEYLAMNPNALIPTMKEGDFILFESHPILRYLCRQHSFGNLYPEDSKQLAIADQWMEWNKFQVLGNLMPAFVQMIRTAEADRNDTVITNGVKATNHHLKTLDRHLQGRQFVLGDHFSMADIPTGALLYKYYNLQIDRVDLPNLEAWYQRLCARPAYQTHAMIPFGNNPKEWLELEKAGA